MSSIKSECLVTIAAFNTTNDSLPKEQFLDQIATIKTGCFENVFSQVQKALVAIVKKLEVPGTEDFESTGILPEELVDIYPLICIRQQQLDFYAFLSANLLEMQKLYDGIVNSK